MPEEAVRIVCADGYPLAAGLWRGGARGAVAIAPALGVPRRFYADFARHLRERGYSVLVFDYRGIGDSAGGPRRGREIRLEDWGRLDIDAVLTWAKTELRPRRLFLVGHSAGAQLPGLAPASGALDGIVMVAGSAPHAGLYPFPFRLNLGFLVHVLIPVLASGRDHVPGKRVGMGNGAIPAGVIAQWARWARTPGYLFDPAHGLDTSRYAQLRLPVLAWRFADDAYAPERAVEALLWHYTCAQITRRAVTPQSGPIGHFGFFRARHRDTLWQETADWLEIAGAARTSPGTK